MRFLFPLGLALAAGGCAALSALGPGPPEDGWTREKMHVRVGRCINDECRLKLAGSAGRLDVTTRTKVYGPHQIPGWDDQSAAQRAANSIFFSIVRMVGGTTEHVRIGFGTRTVAHSADEGLRLQCSFYWMQDEEQKSDPDFDVETASVRRLSQGTQCTAAESLDPDRVRWRYQDGIAPPRDSLAMVYDSLNAAGSPLLGLTPPITLERLTAGGDVEEHYPVERELVMLGGYPIGMRLHVARASGEPVAVLHVASALDLAPDATPEERNILRLIAAALLVAAGELGN